MFYRNVSEGAPAPYSAYARWKSFAIDAPYYSAWLYLEKLIPSLRPWVHENFIVPFLVPEHNRRSVRPYHIQLTDSYPDMYEEMELHIPLNDFPRAFGLIASFVNTTTKYNVNFIVGGAYRSISVEPPVH